MKAFWDSKTVWINGLTSVAAIVGLVVQQNGLLPTAWIGYAVLALAIVNLILRFVTGEPIGLPTPPTATTVTTTTAAPATVVDASTTSA